ncbi:ribonuclease R [Oceanomicrobium pacificus]|uniref:Ribonuclease R n=1 Tax=Oceanomicrobium pacificus TaxID=2692916 RepID=A0A6B0U0Y0_9RHOB|nr:ribonuclease R [Oceanomicrobium pacificus]MXU66844.1 ribonuclease R [Oceanomicrobium pacificus]
MTPFPTKDEIRDWIRDNPGRASKRDVARAFNIKGAGRIELKRILRELTAEGAIPGRKRSDRGRDGLAPVELLQVIARTDDGDLLAEPTVWEGKGTPPRALFVPQKGGPALGIGDRILCRLSPVEGGDPPLEARLIRKIGSAPNRVLGIFRQADFGGRIEPVDKKSGHEWRVEPGDRNGARDGELVEAIQIGPRNRMGLPKARVTERLGDPQAPKSVSLIAIHEHGIPDSFPDRVLEEAAKAEPVTEPGRREDLRDIPLLTIDPADARDRDDAVCALPDPDPENEGGFILWVAIADVAHYVRPGSALDREARKRGNSTYFPDRVVPMLPDALSGDLCSLHADVPRPCMALRIVIGADGEKRAHRFTRGLMRSRASLAYEAAQAAADGDASAVPDGLAEEVIAPLWQAYAALKKARDRRAPLHLDLPERQIILSDEGRVTSVAFKERLDAHRLIEEFMVLANVCAAETLEQRRRPTMYRVHEEPNPDKIEALRAVLEEVGLTLAKGQVLKTSQFNRLLDAAADTEDAEMVSLSVLRSMTQAYYSPRNFGHFGLNLKRYAHFTSPIRRYADLLVHRALIASFGWGSDGLTPEEEEQMEEIGEAISQTERRSMLAERDTNDRYLAAYLADRVGAEFEGRVSGVAKFGLFVKLDETGADGLIPVSALGHEYFRHDPDDQTLTGEQSGRVIGLGMPATVRLSEAVPVTGGLLFELLSIEGKALPRGKGRRAGKGRRSGPASGKRKQIRHKIKRNKVRKGSRG